ncbi:hypothetical protein GYMLUDRAFT_41684 [Collybiopsis luxurians FD-317 M1]|uniref:F-box domain-containing protein n=1 Tax=Collybiopsis luxurians FD-317 M1 TaxID=944289 RepID=A0A0D0D140_9AGAR|nr:hypothetical protein GYMLUDRAFT_41684 [Collybiopsis luxurians FD-317 M1]
MLQFDQDMLSSDRQSQPLPSLLTGLRLNQASRSDCVNHAAIDNLPVELLSQIFLELLADLPMSVPFDCQQLWQLGHVSAFWRSVVHSNMSLAWSNIKVNFRPSSRAASLGQTSAEVLRICLERSRDCPLTIAFTCASNAGENDWLPCWDLLMGVCDRWRIIDFFIPITVLSKFAPVKGRIPALETLYLSLEPQNAHSLPHPVDVFEEAPKLCSVIMSSHLSMQSFRLPWKQITSYRTQRMEVEDCIKVLRLAPLLHSLCVRLDATTRSHIRAEPPAADTCDYSLKPLTSLTGVSLNGLMRPGSEHVLFQRLLMLSGPSEILFPSVMELRLVVSPGSLSNFVTPPFATSCFSSALTKLTIRGVFDASEDYAGAREFLANLPSVQKLSFGVCFHHDREVVNTLYNILLIPPSSDRDVVLPKLEELMLEIDYGDVDGPIVPMWALKPMRNMLKSRRRTMESAHLKHSRPIPAQLQKFHLSLSSWNASSLSGWLVDVLEDLGKEGLELRVS